MEELLKIFVNWAYNCGEDSFYIFDNTDEAIERFMVETDADSFFEVVIYNEEDDE